MSDHFGQFIDGVTTATREGASQYRHAHAIVAIDRIVGSDGSKRN